MPGERHAGPPRRRDGSGLRVAILPALDAHEKPLMWPWMPVAIDVALGWF